MKSLSREGFLAVGVATAMLVLGGVAAFIRFTGGFAVSTHLSDRMPWGLWITFDLCGVALAAGGFLLAGTVHVLHLKRFEPLLRPTVLTSFIMYQLVAIILVVDLGRPYRFWHPLVMWQPHSVMFEITFCLSLYTLVLVVEFLPAVLEHFGRWAWAEAIHHAALPVVIAGMILSTLHQSSFGSLFLIIPEKLHPLWYTPVMPILFLVSAIAGGLAMVVVQSMACGRFLGLRLPDTLIRDVCRINRVVLWIYGGLKLGDLIWRWPLEPALNHPGLLLSWGLEVGVGVLLPALVLGVPTGPAGVRRGSWVSLCVMAGVVLNRVNISWFGLFPYTQTWYVPHWMEAAITGACVAAGVVAFVAAVKWLPVYPVPKKVE